MNRPAVILLLSFAGLGGCSVTEIVTPDETVLDVTEEATNEDLALDIGIVEFADGIPSNNDPAKTRVFDDIRRAEARYLPYHLKTTMERAGYWGAVRVVPTRASYTDVVIDGAIEQSDGEYIKVDVTVEDASGEQWYRKEYRAQTGLSSYSENRDRRRDPYQKVFNDISNDLRVYVEALPPERIRAIRQISELRFFSEMSPAAYGGHLQEDKKGLLSIERLPAENDPTVARLRQIRERDRLVVDTLNEHYANFYYGIAIPYQSWRKTAREESVNYRKVKRSAHLQTALGALVTVGSLAYDKTSSSRSTRRMQGQLQNIAIGQGIETIFQGVARHKEANIHVEAIKELSESFGAEAAPMVISVEGETRRLTGTAAAQYESWRRLLREIYEAETGFVEVPQFGEPERVAEPRG